MDCIRQVVDHGTVQVDENVQIYEILGLSIEISAPQCHDELVEKLGDKAVIKRTLAKFSKGADMPDRPFTYGACIFDHSGVNQFDWLVDRLKTKRECKSATIGLLIPGSQAANLPCLTTVDVKIRNDRLEVQFFFRSQNIFGRQYANLLALANLQAELAEKCLVTVGALRGYIASGHIYAFDIVDARRIVSGEVLTIRDKYYTDGPQSIRT
jgi:thymidylate synthase